MQMSFPHIHGHQDDEILDHIANIDDFQIVAKRFDLLSDTTRLKIFWILCHREKCVLELSKMMQITSAAISHHLKALKEAGLILSRRKKKEVYYQVAESKETQFLHDMIEDLLNIACPGETER